MTPSIAIEAHIDRSGNLRYAGEMRLPNADQAVIAPEKLRGYLLNPRHRRGATKARVLLAMGYQATAWEKLEMDLRIQHLAVDIAQTSQSVYGQRFDIVAPLTGPNGSQVRFPSIWQIDAGNDIARFITMYPE